MSSSPLRRIYTAWWPLAFSWLLMGVELPALSAVIARLPQPVINLAAYGGVVYPLALIIESPIIMLLAASTALCRDWASYRLVRRYMLLAGAALTALHVLIAFTPLYYVIVEGILGVPPEIVQPARIGLMIMTPWSWAIAYRRFNQGVLIRYGRSSTVGVGTVVRIAANFSVLALGFWIGTIPGIVVGASAVACGVVAEAIYAGVVVRPVVNIHLRPSPGPTQSSQAAQSAGPALRWPAFWAFYIPLVLTQLLTLLANPIGSAALSRMPQALESLAVWPVVTGLIFMLRTPGIAYNEVVVALLEKPGMYAGLKRFAALLSLLTTAALLLIVATPLSRFWMATVSDLPAGLASLGRLSLWIALPLPALSVLQSWYQGALLHGRKTRPISEAVVIYLLTSVIVLGAGVAWSQVSGLYIGQAALTLSVLTQTAWLWLRSLPVLEIIRRRDVLPQEAAL
jgi:hypothetical protein